MGWPTVADAQSADTPPPSPAADTPRAAGGTAPTDPSAQGGTGPKAPAAPGPAPEAGAEPPNAPSAQPAPPAPRLEEGFVWLFDGTSLKGWVGDTAGYAVQDAAIACTPAGRNIYTEREYGDFTLRLEFMLTPGANNGIGLRAPREGDAAFDGIEVQVLDDAHPTYASIKPWQAHGSVYGVVPAKRGALKPAGEWNEQEIDLQGTRIRVTLNGTVIVDADLYRHAHDGTIDGKPHPGLRRTSGHIGFLGHGDRVLYRRIRIRENP
ncbi:MAG: DUF1080 domain-containing protein [Phycisphaerales bacterium]|nr:DUF1080 domain-containing protein [Phycisphaerales bacterium]